jgi:disulfide bond formation protein DsbB
MKKWTFYFAWFFTLIGLLVSLYYGEILGMEPCRLCWYQRCALFPLALLLGVAIYRDDFHFLPYGRILAGVGLLLALVQIFIPASLCNHGCTERTAVVWFLTFPMFSAIGFALIFGLLSFKKLR